MKSVVEVEWRKAPMRKFWTRGQPITGVREKDEHFALDTMWNHPVYDWDTDNLNSELS